MRGRKTTEADWWAGSLAFGGFSWAVVLFFLKQTIYILSFPLPVSCFLVQVAVDAVLSGGAKESIKAMIYMLA